MIKGVGEVNNLISGYKAKDWMSNLPAVEAGFPSDGESLAADGAVGELKKTFGQVLAESVSKVNDLQKEANVAIEKLSSGESENLHETMMIVEQAEIAFKTMNQIRQKVLDAYREIMRMQI